MFMCATGTKTGDSPAGEGTFDFSAFIRALRRVNYAGAMIVEPYLALVKSDEALEKSIRMLKRIAGEQNKSMD